MHIPDGLLDPVQLIVYWILTVAILAFGFFKMGKEFEEEDSEKLIPYIGVLAAVIFAFQFVNYPIPGGTSGHLVGGTLVAVILGPWASLIVLFLILLVQSFFGDGGITALGANAFNMGVIGGILGFYIVKLIIYSINRIQIKREIKLAVATGIGSYIAILLASFVAGLQIAIAGVVPFEISVPLMVFWHLFIGIGEGVISALIVYFIYKVKPSLIITENPLEVI